MTHFARRSGTRDPPSSSWSSAFATRPEYRSPIPLFIRRQQRIVFGYLPADFCGAAATRLTTSLILLSCAVSTLQGCGDGATNSSTPKNESRAAEHVSRISGDGSDAKTRASMKFAVVLEDVVTLPATSETPPRARINFMFHAADGSGRAFVNDMTGKVYVIK